MRPMLQHPVFSIALTFVFYAAAQMLHRRWRALPPIVLACVPIIVFLLLLHEPYRNYNRGGSVLTWCLGPATVALAVPMYRNSMPLRSSLPRLAMVVLAGALVGMVTAGGTAWLLGAPRDVVMSAVPKSVTTPIAIEVSRQLNGIPQITIAMVIGAGVLGSSVGRSLLKVAGVRDDRAIGAAMGTSAHGIGTASLVRHSEMQTTVSSWAMAAAGVFTSLLGTLLAWIMR
ncbi:LrgB family protein [Acidobacteria bacterium AB60]|nr:LrgB family protein [Acidobacteria bacterium AB60]